MTTVAETLNAEEHTDLFTVAHDLLMRAAAERNKGNSEAANKLLLAAGNVMGENIAPSEGAKGVPKGTQQVADLLRTGWKEVSEIAETTKMSPNHIHVILGRLKGKGLKSQSVKRYRIVESK